MLSSVTKKNSVSGIVLAGGASSRLGQDKALIDVAGVPLIERVVLCLRSVVDEVVLVTDRPRAFAFLDLPMTGDLYPKVGVLGGLHAGLSAIRAEYGLVVGCDMPFLNADLLRYMITLADGCDIVLPRLGEYSEPLHAIYSRRCLPCIEQTIEAGRRRILDICASLCVCHVHDAEIAVRDPRYLSFFNINDAQDLKRMREILALEDLDSGC